jgi:hypothetical protein
MTFKQSVESFRKQLYIDFNKGGNIMTEEKYLLLNFLFSVVET